MKLFYLVVFFTCTTAVQAQTIQIVKDINADVEVLNNHRSSSITNFKSAGPHTYFVADDFTSGKEPNNHQ